MVTILHSLNKDFLAWLEPAQMLLYTSQRKGNLHIANEQEVLNWQVKAVLSSRHLNRWRLIIVVDEAALGSAAWTKFLAQMQATQPASQDVTVLMVNASVDSAAGLNLKALTTDLLPVGWSVIRLPDLMNTAWYAPLKAAYIVLALLDNADALKGEYYLLEDNIKLDELVLAEMFQNYRLDLSQAQKQLAATTSEVAVRLHDESLKNIIPLRVDVPDSSDALLDKVKPEISWLQQEDQRHWFGWQADLQTGLTDLRKKIKEEMQGFLVSRLERLERTEAYQEARSFPSNTVEVALRQNQDSLQQQRDALEKNIIPEQKAISSKSWNKHKTDLNQNLQHRPKTPHVVFSTVFAALAIAFAAFWYSSLLLKGLSLGFLALLLLTMLFFARRSIMSDISSVVVGQESEVDEHLAQTSQTVVKRSKQSLDKLKLWVQGSNVQNLEVALLEGHELNQKQRFHEHALQQHLSYAQRIVSALPKQPRKYSTSQDVIPTPVLEQGYIENKLYSSTPESLSDLKHSIATQASLNFGTQHRQLNDLSFTGLDTITLEEAT